MSGHDDTRNTCDLTIHTACCLVSAHHHLQGVLGVDFSGSTFVAVSGHDDNPQHLDQILHTAQAMLAVASGMTHADGSPLAVKLGIHLGPLTTGTGD